MNPYAPYNIPALGQPLFVGTLFDARSIQPLNISPWNDEELKEGTQIHPLRHISENFILNDSKKERRTELGITVHFEAFLTGFIHDSGAAAFYFYEEANENTFRVVYHVTITCFSKNLKPGMLENIHKHNIIDDATHVVAGGVYGGQFFFVFERVYSKDEVKIEVNATVQKTLNFYFRGAGVDGEGKYAEEALKISVKCCGDVDVPVTSVKEAVEICKNFDKYIGRQGERAVPLTVTLLPLANLPKKKKGLFQFVDTNK